MKRTWHMQREARLNLTLVLWATVFGLSAERAQAQEYDIKLESGTTPVCAAYARALSKAAYAEMARCARPDAGNADGFKIIGRKPLSPQEVAQLFEPVADLLANDQPRKGTAQARSKDAPIFARIQQETIQAGNPYRFFYRLEPRADVDNDGKPDDVVIWKDASVPCGFVRYDAPEFSPTYALILNSDGKLDKNRTLAIFGGTPPRKWLGDSFGVFQFKGEFYFDTFNSYSNLPRDHADENAFLNTLSVYQRKNGRTRLVCEISIAPVG